MVSKLKIDMVVLVCSNLLIGLLDFTFNLYCSEIYGPEGLGLMSLVGPVYCVFLSFITECIVITVSKMISRLNYYGNYEEMSATAKVATLANLLWGTFVAFVMFASAGLIAQFFLKDINLAFPIRATCPLTILMSVSNVLKGYFLGRNKIKIPAFINMAEKLFRFPVLYLLIKLFLNQTAFHPISLVYFCYSIGEALSVLLLLLYAKLSNPCHTRKVLGRKENPAKAGVGSGVRFNGSGKTPISSEFAKQTIKEIVRRAIPLCLTNCLLEFSGALCSVIVKSGLISIGFTYKHALASLGKFRGMVLPLMSYPMIIISSMVMIMVPRLSTIITTGNRDYARKLIIKVMGIALFIGLVTGIIFLIYGDALGVAIYGRDDLGLMISFSAILVPVMYMAATSNSILISMGEEKISFRNSLLQQIILLVSLRFFTAIKYINIYGYIIGMFICYVFQFVINLKDIRSF